MAFTDVAIIGGGPAGLTAASTLARQLLTAVVFDSSSYRNAAASHMHMVPTWDHRDPKEFRSAARQDITSRYATIQFADVEVGRVEKIGDSHFKVWDADGHERDFRKVILAVGSSNVYPDIEGYEQLWTKKIFHCLFCHGYEDRGAASAGVLAVAPLSIPAFVLHGAETAAQLSKEVTLYTHGDQDLAGQLGAFANATFKVEPRRIQRLLVVDNSVPAAAKNNTVAVTVEFEDGSTREEAFLLHSPQTTAQGPFASQLGLATTPMGDIAAEAPMHLTSVRGVFAAGDCVTPYKVIPGAISSGCNAAVAASTQLLAEKHGHASMI